jgi:hypothetical protein
MKLAKRILCGLGAALVLAAAVVPYSEVRNAERAIDRRIEGHDVADPIDLLGFTRGVYLEGTGAVFTAEVNLVLGPVISPFRPDITKDDIAKLHERKRVRLPELRKVMTDALISTATTMKSVPPQEQVVFGVTMFYQPWEDAAGLPRQIVMQAKRQSLLDFEKGTLKSLDGSVKVLEQ